MSGDFPPTPEFPVGPLGSIERAYADGYAAAQAQIESDAKVIAALREALGNCMSYLESETGMTMKHPILKIAKGAIEQTAGE